MVEASRAILSFNTGSSSLKFAMHEFSAGAEKLLAEGAAEGIGSGGGRIWVRSGANRMLSDASRGLAGFDQAFHGLLDEMDRLKLRRPDAVGHRIVHGGPHHFAPERITPALVDELKKIVPFAPLHIPLEIQGIELFEHRFPDLPQVACFDTGFHKQMPEVARRFAIPRGLQQEGVFRYGFHGLSYEYIMQTLGPAAPARVVIAHLGNGASIAAVRDGVGIDTTMGFTPAGGFMMGTRTGDLDPGVIVFLLNQKGYDGARLERLVNRESGMLGVSDLSSDVKTLLEKRASDEAAALALDMFCYQVRKTIGAMAAALGGLDLLVFTAGIGERAAPIRSEICRGLEHLGIKLDDARNQVHADLVSAPDARCAVRVIPTNEDLMIARHTRRVIFAQC
jgi:acetate kinase